MKPIIIRYGESVTLPVDSGDVNAVSADIYIGKPGEAYVLTTSATLTNGEGVFTFSKTDTEIPLDTYYYQINVTDGDGGVRKYPTPRSEDTESNLPKFIVAEALDQIEVS